MAKVLVTGANGFVGSNLCRCLLDQGDDVAGLVRPASNRRFLNGIKGLNVVEGDITDRTSLAPAVAGAEIVYHTAGYVSDWGPWQAFRDGNVLGVVNIVEAARDAGVRRIVHLSSVSIYGFPGGVDIGEDEPPTLRPHDRYITTKAEGERLALEYDNRGIEVTAIRPGTVYGTNDHTTFAKLAPALESGRFAFVNGGRPLMSPCYIDNLTDTMQRAAESPGAPGQAFNAADAGRVTWRQFIEWICDDLGCPAPRLSVPAAVIRPLAAVIETAGRAIGMRESPPINRYRIRAVAADHHYSTAKAERLLDARSIIKTREGVRRAVAWHRMSQHNGDL